MADILIIDGYNFLHSWPELVSLKESSLAHARDKLITELVNYQAYWGGQVVIVFDAHKANDTTPRKEKIGSVEVIYTGEGETADMLIEKMVGDYSPGNQVYVATSDGIEQRIILGKGALRIPVTELKDSIEKARKEMTVIANKIFQNNPIEYHLRSDTRKVLENWRRK